MNLILTKVVELTVHHFALCIVIVHLQKIDNRRVIHAILYVKRLCCTRHVPTLTRCCLPLYHLGRGRSRLEISHLWRIIKGRDIVECSLLEGEDSTNRVFMQFVFFLILWLFRVTSHEQHGHYCTESKDKTIYESLCFHRFYVFC